MKIVKVKDIEISNDKPFVLIAGPCAIESMEHAMFMCGKLKKLTDKLGIPFIYKSSFDKANRTSINSKRGVGIAEGAAILKKVKETYGCPVLTDVHEARQVEFMARIVDVLQIPAFLCRQTDLLLACGKTGLPINVKKAQFMAPGDMINVIHKIESTQNTNVLLCERGTSFGYNNLVVDFRSIIQMGNTGYPVIFDATHSVQRPGAGGSHSTGDREMVPPLARAAISIGVAGVFIETHEDPDNALSDGPNSMRLDDMKKLLQKLKKIDRLIK